MKPSASHYTANQVRAVNQSFLNSTEFWEHTGIKSQSWAVGYQHCLRTTKEIRTKEHSTLILRWTTCWSRRGIWANPRATDQTWICAKQLIRPSNFNTSEQSFWTRNTQLLLIYWPGQYDGKRGKDRRSWASSRRDGSQSAWRWSGIWTLRIRSLLKVSYPTKGGHHRAKCKVASAAPIIVMKCAAMEGRYEDKDPYDLYYFIRYLQRSRGSSGSGSNKTRHQSRVNEGSYWTNAQVFWFTRRIRTKSGARFLEVQDDEEQSAIIRQSVYQNNPRIAWRNRCVDCQVKRATVKAEAKRDDSNRRVCETENCVGRISWITVQALRVTFRKYRKKECNVPKERLGGSSLTSAQIFFGHKQIWEIYKNRNIRFVKKV